MRSQNTAVEAAALIDILRSDTTNAPSGLSAKGIADSIGVGYSTLMNGVNKHIEGHKFHITNLLPFMRVTGSVQPLRYLCLSMGYRMEPLDLGDVDAAQQSASDELRHLCKVMESRAKDIPALDNKHRAQVRDACRQSIRALLHLLEQAEVSHA
ncbi:phage regulatory CII family protein [Nitratidesulfovibrio vulgaris]|uniref:Transcriptional regulator CII, putative n=1 Tax=Nitratidesulfovibrio vulgaris (strain DP4) TaxID=391774 RepID=A0A0H3A7Q5_NITV4|nr:phage regulatory CII family protein [Nitratidesulfovibrio vulgaris]ABM28062.1 transcriptional regulator CII, putative [Nitratidesulfovibrio vulgaris DP4]